VPQHLSRNIARDSHYVPQSLLRRWSLDGSYLYAYRVLVSRPNVPDWRRVAIRGLARHRDLYTVFEGNQELDEFERWLSTQFEQPGDAAIDKLLQGKRLGREDWHSLARLLAAQDLRTPLTFLELMDRWQRDLPDILKRTLQVSLEKLTAAKRMGAPLVASPVPTNEFTQLLKVSIEPPDGPEGQRAIRAEVVAGRRLWIAAMRHLLTGVAVALCGHQWSIVEPGDDEEWPLTDHPVLKLNYYGSGRYDFRGGWGKRGTEIMMPLSPRRLLFVHVGKDAGKAVEFTPEQTWLVRRLLCERAHRWIFATRPKEWVSKAHPRIVDAEAFAIEARAWERWHRDQMQSEMSAEDKN